MLLIGNKSGFKNPNNETFLKLIEDNIIIFGANESGKTTLFKKVNKYSENYKYENFKKHIICTSDFKIGFIDQNGKIYNGEKIDGSFFSKNSIREITKMNYSTYKKELKICGLNDNPNFLNLDLFNKLKKIKNENLKEYFTFTFFEYTYNDFENIILHLKKKMDKMSKKEEESLISKFFFKFNIFEKNNVFYKCKKCFLFFKQIKNINQIDKEKLFHLYKDEGIDNFLNFLEEIYYFSYYKTIKLMNKEDDKIIKNEINIKKIKKILKSYQKNSKSFGAKKINNIINNIYFLLDSENKQFIIDDPFDGLSQDNKFEISNLFVKLIKLNINFIILTNDVLSFQFLRNAIYNEKKSKKLSTAILKKYENVFLIDNISEIDNILFKWNDKKYYEDIKKFIKRWDVNYEIASHLLTIHSEVIQDFNYLSSLFFNHENRKNKIKDLYDLVIDCSKSENFTKLLINKKIKKREMLKGEMPLFDLIIGNAWISKIFPLFDNSTSLFTYGINKGYFFLVQALKFTFYINLYDILKEKINKNFNFNKEWIKKNEDKKNLISHFTKIINKNKIWRNIFKHRNKFPLINALYFQPISKELIELFRICFGGKIRKIIENKNSFKEFKKIKENNNF